jgi:hypothetical protein
MTTIRLFSDTLLDSLGKNEGLTVEFRRWSGDEACFSAAGRSWLVSCNKGRELGSALSGCLHAIDRRGAKERRWFRCKLDDYGNRVEIGIAVIEDAPHVYIAVNDYRVHLAPRQIEHLAAALAEGLAPGPDQQTAFDLLAKPDWGFPRDPGW